jgi:predicted nucleic acid-binding protein
VVIDANLAVYSVINTPQSTLAAGLLESFVHQNLTLCAPRLWWFEVTSVIHRYQFSNLISEPAAYAALAVLVEGLEVQPIEVPMRSAYDWATRLRQKSVYDGFYLAAAEQEGLELWTADHALVNNAHQLGINWVHGPGDSV